MNIKNNLIGAAVSVIIFGSLAVAAFAVGTNGSFELGTTSDPFTTLSAGSTNITDWTINSGSVDYIQNLWQASDGVRSIDMNGFTTGSISQTIPTTVGAIYNVTFDLSGNPGSVSDPTHPYYSPSNKQLTVSANGAQTKSFFYDTSIMQNSYPNNMKYVGKTYSFTATGTSTVLTFASAIPGAFGPVLDNVVISETLPGNKEECKKDGWKAFNVFKNQGDCVSYVATGGKNLPANLPQ